MSLSVSNLGIDGLENVEQIGTGGSSRVYRARQVDLDRVVAIKVLNPGDDQGVAKRFDRERKAMGRLSLHEGIVPVYSSGVTAHGEPYLVMPYYPNGSLQDQIDTGPMEWETAVSYVDVAAETIAAAHDEGVVHLDLKPANILLTNTGAPRIADFGIAKLTTGAAAAGTTGGAAFTPAYSAPETFLDGQTGPPSDVYGLGATLWALLVGHPPFLTPGDDTNLMAVIGRVVNNPVGDLRRFTPAPICEVIERAMAKRPENRFQTARQFSLALKQAAAASSPNFAPVDAGRNPGTTLFPAAPPRRAATAAGPANTRMMTHVDAVELPPSLAMTAPPAPVTGPRPLLEQTAQPLAKPADGPPLEPRGPVLDLDRFRPGPILLGLLAFVLVVGAALVLLNRGDGQTSADPTLPTDVASPSTSTGSSVSSFGSSVTGPPEATMTSAPTTLTTSAPTTAPTSSTTVTTVASSATTAAPSTTVASSATTTSTSSSSSSSTSSTVAGPVQAPTGLTATVTGDSVTLKWTAPTAGPPPIGGYRIYRGSTPVGTVGRTTTTYTGSGLADGTYSYTVRSIGADDSESGPSNSATVSVGPPQITSFTVGTPTTESVPVSFASNQCVTYRISAVGAGNPPVITGPATSCAFDASVTVQGLLPGQNYQVNLVIENASGQTDSDMKQVSTP